MSFAIPFRQLGLVALLAGATLATTSLQADTPATPRLDVAAEAQIDVVPDRATLTARLWERTAAISQQEDVSADPDALREARERLESRSAELIQTMEAAGLESEAINAGSLSVQPEFVASPRRSDEEQETLVRTRLERPFEVKVDDLERLPVLLDALTEAGVNSLDGVTYDLADRDAATDEALVKALEKARHKADLMAETLGVTLGDVMSVSETRSPVFAPRMMAMSADARESAPQAEYRPGTIAIEAGVSVSWEIER
ncbi:SIMPL domain-containing protein [Halomonas urumqiensis]|uniref:SIMPL domain-containing protein n=1 Tax=Halomonas urumqiensis TaxID=1684789 RepID=A0A2N7UHM0_9GAMM|nr:SIMPL domain-containing protein [Halomonas urumqiensis]PMR79957.1 SIMPL domain-containing protein [Halomonas urumqiensis]PTB02018.1 DUF541 domain-containing protein [Halomonas urumqiensis]GHE21455.1 membrane protein [Halomonas urumqiensis]